MGWIGTEFGARWSVAAGGAVVLVTGVACVILVSRRSEKTLREHVRNVWTRRRPAEAS